MDPEHNIPPIKAKRLPGRRHSCVAALSCVKGRSVTLYKSRVLHACFRLAARPARPDVAQKRVACKVRLVSSTQPAPGSSDVRATEGEGRWRCERTDIHTLFNFPRAMKTDPEIIGRKLLFQTCAAFDVRRSFRLRILCYKNAANSFDHARVPGAGRSILRPDGRKDSL